MSTNKLAQVIRKIVREEVRKEVRQLLTEQKVLPTKKSQSKSGLKHALGLNTSTARRTSAPIKKQQSTNADTFDRNSLAAKMGYGDIAQSSTPSIQEMVPTRNTSGGRANNVDVDPSVAKALTRDYSELVKKFKK